MFYSCFYHKKIYRRRNDIQKAKEYIEAYWKEKYNAAEAAKAANLSMHHFSRLFKKHTGMTPYEYYVNIKIRRIQERLRDESTVSEAFSACGVDYHGHFSKVFKVKVGLSPSQYRASVKQKR